MKKIYANNLTTLSLGRQGENLARQVVFDIRDLESLYGSGTVEVIHQRPGDAQPYPLAVQRDGTLVTWDVTATDTEMSAATANERYGKCELRYYAGETLAKSQIWRTWVESAMDTPSETAPPEPEQGWVDQVLAVGVSVKEATDSAKTYSNSAEQSASGAAQSAQEAAGSASAASTSATNAKASEESAAESASAAANSAASASASASAASGSASAAKASETAAAKSASAAQQSATSAAESAAVYDTVVADVTQLKEDISEVADKHESKNLYNKDASGVEVDKYTYYNGKTEVDTNFLTTDFMRVDVGKIITFYAYAPNESNEIKRLIGQIIAYDANKNVLADKGGMNVSSLVVQKEVSFVRLCFRKAWQDVMVQMSDDGSQAVYEPYFEPYFTVKGVEDITRKVESLNARLDNQNKFNHVGTTSDFLSDFKQSLAKNVVVSYVANFDTFNSLKIGYTSKDDYTSSRGYTDYFEITPTHFIMHREDMADVSWEHGLTIDKFIGIELSFDIAKRYTLTITTIGGTFTKSNNIYLGRTYYPFAVIDGVNVKNNKLSATCKDLRKNIFAFGDSYFSNISSRWMYYLQNKDSICINQYAGESSESAIVDFRTLVKYGNPKFVLWCLGMNDRTDTDENTPSRYWLPYITEVIDTCERNNIVPILATIPSVPNISHKAKNKWIRDSGYHYIDFANAVEADENGNWYSGLLSGDNVHPTEKGAKVLYSRAITDFPDLLVIC